MRGSRKRAPRPRLIDRLLRLFHRTPFSGRYTLTIPAGVELRMSRRYLEAHRRIFGGIPPAGTTSRTILLHPMTLDWSAEAMDGLLAHELTHVAQFDRWGFFGTYARYVWGLWKHGYGDHPLEHEARSGARRHREPESRAATDEHDSASGSSAVRTRSEPVQIAVVWRDRYAEIRVVDLRAVLWARSSGVGVLPLQTSLVLLQLRQRVRTPT